MVNSIKEAMAQAKAKKRGGSNLLDSAFPQMGVPAGSHLGSQSMSPGQAPGQDYVGNDPMYPNIGG